MFGERYGTAEPSVVALHGWERTHADFASVLAGRDAIALDLPGFGATPAPPEPWGSPEYAELVSEVLDSISAPVVRLGHSFGGRVAIHVAARAPERVRGVVLTGAPLMRVAAEAAPRVAPGYRVARWLNRRGALSEKRMEALRTKYGSADYARATGVMRGVHVRLVNENYDDVIDALHGPVELVWGDDDTAAPLAGAQALAARLGDRARLTVVAGAGHFTPSTASDALGAAIDRVSL
jgi:pimeloyl-ACP methyl ester carboxylesterase